MKRKLGRELLLLSLPILFLGGVALWKSRTGANMLWVPTLSLKDTGPMRVEYSTFQPVEVQPSFVSRGFIWAGKTRVVTKGEDVVPPNMVWVGGSTDFTSDTRVVYRKGSKWSSVPWNGGRNPIISILFGLDDEVTLHLNLNGVPKDAEEIHLRGSINVQRHFNGTWPATTKPPKNATVYSKVAVLNYKSKPFDILVKGSKDPWPNPIVSHDPGVKFVRAYYTADSLGKVTVTLQMRRANSDRKGAPDLVKYRLLDAGGRNLNVCGIGTNSQRIPAGFGEMSEGVLSKDVPKTDVFVPVWTNVEPCKNQKNIKLPLKLDIEFSDAGKWPFKVKVPIDTKTYDSFNKYPFR